MLLLQFWSHPARLVARLVPGTLTGKHSLISAKARNVKMTLSKSSVNHKLTNVGSYMSLFSLFEQHSGIWKINWLKQIVILFIIKSSKKVLN